jgi:hypothetical protein
MTARFLPIITSLILLVCATSAFAQGVPLAGEGENVEPVAHIDLGEVGTDATVQKNEIDLAGDWAFVSASPGLFIVNISNPAKPFIEGKWACESGWGDVDINADATIAVLTDAHDGECLDADTAVVILDISNKAKPRKISSITRQDAQLQYVHTATLNDNLLFLNPQVAAFYRQTHKAVAVYDVSNPKAPKFLNHIEFEKDAVAHDSYLDRRPDGKKLFYSASIHFNDIYDITDLSKPALLQQTTPGEATISHQLEPNHNRTVAVMVDESAVDTGLVGGILGVDSPVPTGWPATCGKAGAGPAAADVGSTMFFALNEDGTFAVTNGNGAAPLGSFNAPPSTTDRTCTSHVFWQAPNENRMTQAFYAQGARVVDFEDPANPKELGWFKAEPSTIYWSAKPHRGYIFATDMERGLDILKYTGEGGARWPATSGPAEIQRAAVHGVPYKPIVGPGGKPVSGAPLPGAGPTPGGATGPGATSRDLGRFKFTAKLKKIKGKKGKKVKLTITFTDSAKKRAGVARFSKKAGRKASAKVAGVAVAGTYKWVIKAGRKTLKRGTLRVKKQSGLTLSPNAKLAASVR